MIELGRTEVAVGEFRPRSSRNETFRMSEQIAGSSFRGSSFVSRLPSFTMKLLPSSGSSKATLHLHFQSGGIDTPPFAPLLRQSVATRKPRESSLRLHSIVRLQRIRASDTIQTLVL